MVSASMTKCGSFAPGSKIRSQPAPSHRLVARSRGPWRAYVDPNLPVRRGAWARYRSGDASAGRSRGRSRPPRSGRVRCRILPPVAGPISERDDRARRRLWARRLLGGPAQEPAAAVVSGLPLFTKPLRTRLRLLFEAFGVMAPGAPFVQFTYNAVAPIPRAARSRAGRGIGAGMEEHSAGPRVGLSATIEDDRVRCSFTAYSAHAASLLPSQLCPRACES